MNSNPHLTTNYFSCVCFFPLPNFNHPLEVFCCPNPNSRIPCRCYHVKVSYHIVNSFFLHFATNSTVFRSTRYFECYNYQIFMFVFLSKNLTAKTPRVSYSPEYHWKSFFFWDIDPLLIMKEPFFVLINHSLTHMER